MSKFSLVLSDDLLTEYYKFTGNSDYDRNIIEKLLHYFKPNFITNTSQLDRIAHKPGKTLESNLRANRLTKQSLEELAVKTRYKIILSTNRNDFPYININDDNIENNFTGTFLRGESREKAIKHIKALCSDAQKSILVYDKYFFNSILNADTLIDLLPKRKLEIRYQINTFSEEQIDKLKVTCPSWIFKDGNYISSHDRYLIIDDKVEIILTSGFSYLRNNEKEITYIVRIVDSHQFK